MSRCKKTKKKKETKRLIILIEKNKIFTKQLNTHSYYNSLGQMSLNTDSTNITGLSLLSSGVTLDTEASKIVSRTSSTSRQSSVSRLVLIRQNYVTDNVGSLVSIH